MPLQQHDTGSIVGFDKHYGRALCYITINRNIYWWTTITINTAIDLRENTDPCSPIKQYQIIREEALSLDVESMIPGPNNASAASFIADFRPGVIIDNLQCSLIEDLLTPAVTFTADTMRGNVQDPGDGSLSAAATTSKYGTFIIERSNVDISRDDFTTMRLTLRALGYGNETIIQGNQGGNVYASDYAVDYTGEEVVDPDFPGA
jgi:hypothetical protein